MNKILAYDTETTSMPEWKIPSGDPKQPHIVQLAAILKDADTGIEISSMDVIIKPEGGWESCPEALENHGITTEMAMDVGVPESLAVEMLYEMQAGAERVAYNRTFDQRIIRIAMKRFFEEDDTEEWARKDNHPCAMLLSRPIMAADPSGLYKNVNQKLAVAFKYFTGKELINAHSAKADAEACMDIYLEILKRQQAEAV
jgi:DNA polymerase III subunit epsilon